ncbi:MAG: CBS domain-containing protein [Gammaproteobacteria bacterium]|jgi:CBS domain-containing protein
MSVGRVCNREVVIASPATSVADAAALMREHHVGDLVIVEESEVRRPVGLVTDRDIVVEIVAQGLDPKSVAIGDLMTRELETVAEDMDFWDALGHMRRHGVRRLPVVNASGGLEGILTLDDVMELTSEMLTGLVSLVSTEMDRERSTRPAR